MEALTGQRLTSPQTRMELWLALQARRLLEQPDTIQMPAAQIPAAQMPNPAAPPAVSVYVDVGGGLPPATPGPG